MGAQSQNIFCKYDMCSVGRILLFKYVVISNFEKLRFYIENAIEFEEFDLFNLTQDKFELLYLCLAKECLLNDIPLAIKQASVAQEENITKQLYNDYSALKRAMFNNIVELNPSYDKLLLYKKTQKLLDRFLFIFFAEDRLLLPPNSIREILKQWETLKELDSYTPLYERFKKYFGYLLTGHKGKQYEIFAYNGGLFEADDVLDNIAIDDTLLFTHLTRLADYNYETEVDVNILGHIFEHSLNEIEQIQAELEGRETDKSKTKRKKDGIFYTPKYITKYIVENTVGALCSEKKKELQIVEDDFSFAKRKEKRKELIEKLDTYRNWLLKLTICDPACGSGAFLVQALNFLMDEHKLIDELQARVLDSSIVFPNIENTILENNLYGVDLNEESVEIAKLSLWLRTAQKGRKLTSLNNNIKCGNSLIDDPAIAGNKAFNWQKEFSEVFADGGFDVVIGNPPYGAKISKEQINYISKKYDNTISGEIDTYIIFYFCSIGLLNSKGILGFITPDTWLTISRAKGMRKFIKENACLVEVYDRYKPFEDAKDTRCHTVIIKAKENGPTTFKVTKVNSKTEILKSYETNRDVLSNFESWNLYTSPNDRNIFDKMEKCSHHLDELFCIKYGLRTGDNQKYLTTDIVKSNGKIKIARGSNILRYNFNWMPEYLISEDNLPKSYFEKTILNSPKIIIQYVRTNSTDENSRWLEATIIEEPNFVPLNSTTFIYLKNEKNSLKYLLALLSSRLMNYYYKAHYTDVNVKPLYLSHLPIPEIPYETQLTCTNNVEIMLSQNKELQELKTRFIKLLSSKYSDLNLTNKLIDWAELDFKTFVKELEKQKIKLSLPEQAEWLDYFEKEKAKAQEIKAIIDKTDKEIDNMVYQLYGLTDEEIRIVEGV